MGDYADMSVDDGIASDYTDLEDAENNIYPDPIDGQIIRRKRMQKTDVVIQDVTVSYLNAFEPKTTPNGDLKYSVSILVPEKDKKNLKNINAAIEAAIAKGIADSKFTKAQASKFKPGKGNGKPIRNGSEEFAAGDRGKEYEGHIFINASAFADSPPGVRDENNQPMIDTTQLYSGCKCHVHVSMYPYNTAGNRGIAAGFQNIMKVADGDRLDGRTSAEEAFGAYAEAEGNSEEEVF